MQIAFLNTIYILLDTKKGRRSVCRYYHGGVNRADISRLGVIYDMYKKLSLNHEL